MGNSYCVNRKEQEEKEKVKEKDNGILKFQHFVNKDGLFDADQFQLGIALNYIMKGCCQGLRNSLQCLEQIWTLYQLEHPFCLFDPDLLAQKYNLIEFQSEGQVFKKSEFSNYLKKEVEFFYEQEILEDEKQYKVMVEIELLNKASQKKVKQYLVIQKKSHTLQNNKFLYIVHDIQKLDEIQQNQPKNKKQKFASHNCQENILLNQNRFETLLNLKTNLFLSQNEATSAQIKIYHFKTFSENSNKSLSEDIPQPTNKQNTNNTPPNNNLLNNSFHLTQILNSEFENSQEYEQVHKIQFNQSFENNQLPRQTNSTKIEF